MGRSQMTDDIRPLGHATDVLAGIDPENRFVAFVDVLGFGGRILRDFDGAFQSYRALLDQWRTVWRAGPGVGVTIYSDSVLLTAETLRPLTLAVNTLCFASLMSDALVRGGIGFGKHLEVHEARNVYVVSEALTRAVDVEKRVSVPCVGLHDSVDVPPDWWAIPSSQRPVIHFEGLTLVNPFGAFWFRSAAGRVQVLMERHPEHHGKHDWFLRLYASVESNAPLVPPEFVSNSLGPRGQKGEVNG